jgi:hypothetical protein
MQRPTCTICGTPHPRVKTLDLTCSKCGIDTPHNIALLPGVPSRRKNALARLSVHQNYWKRNFKQMLEATTFYLVFGYDRSNVKLFFSRSDANRLVDGKNWVFVKEIKVS